jgi:hypothetical protein
MIWLNTLRRWLGWEEVPPATNGETSVLFVLQSRSPMSLVSIRDATNIPLADLRPLLDRLERTHRIRSSMAGTAVHPYKVWWIVR